MTIKGDIAEVERILSSTTEINLDVNNNGWTSLAAAAFGNKTEIAKLLLEAGARPDIKNNDGDTALVFAVKGNQSDLVALLLSHGANPDIRGDGGRSPLIWASMSNQVQVINMLLQAGASPNLEDFTGKSAVDYAESKTTQRKLERAALLEYQQLGYLGEKDESEAQNNRLETDG